MNVTLSRCALFIFACILNTNAEKLSSVGSHSPSAHTLARGGVVILRKLLRNGSTPKLVSADPKNTGESLPFLTRSISNSSPPPSRSSISSDNISCFSAPIRSSTELSPRSTSTASACLLLPFAEKLISFLDSLS